MPRSLMACAVAVVLALCATLSEADEQSRAPLRTRATDPAVKKDGWWIRISPDPKVETITWHFADPGRKGAKPETFTWTRGNGADNFDLPEAVRQTAPLTFEVTATPADGSSSFCLFHGVNGVRRVTLPGTSKGTVDPKQKDKNCTSS